MFKVTERRQETRIDYPIVLHVHTASDIQLDAPISVETWNISLDGLCFMLSRELDLKKRYQIEILINPNIVITAQIKLAWISSIEPKKFLHGVMLNFPSENQCNLLMEFFSSIMKNKKSKTDRRGKERRTDERANGGTSKPKEVDLDRRFDKRITRIPFNLNGLSRTSKRIKLRRVTVTGIGIVSPVGFGKEQLTFAIENSKTGIDFISRFKNQEFPSQSAAEVNDESMFKYLDLLKDSRHIANFNKTRLRKRTDRPTQFGLIATLQAILDSGLKLNKINRGNIGISIGTIMGGLGYAFKEHDIYFESGMKKMDPYTIAAASPNSCSGEIAAKFNFRGPSATFSQGCTSGAMAITYATEQIQLGKVPIMIAGGTDTPFHESTYAAFCRSGMLSPSVNGKPVLPRPMDKNRNGIVLGEGSAILILEDLEHALARDANIYGEILSHSNTCDGYDMIRWRWHGKETSRAIKLALKDAELKASEISMIFVQAAGTYQGDAVEYRALFDVFGKGISKIPISNLKPLIGYTQGACGPFEIAGSCIALKKQIIPGISSFVSSERPLNISPKLRQSKLKNILVNCIGFGGKNISIILSKI